MRRKSETGGAMGDGAGGGFSLIETMVACAILGMILAAMLTMVTQTSGAWRSANSRIEAFQGARRAFDLLASTLGQATLNTYWGYDDDDNPTRYIRRSELHFVVAPAGRDGLPGTPGCGQGVFFQAPAGKAKDISRERLPGLLNHCGFYVAYGSDSLWLPSAPLQVQARNRYRLMFWVADTDRSDAADDPARVFRAENDFSDDTDWVAPSGDAFPLAENVIALLVWPREESWSTTLNSYSYNSRTGYSLSPQPVTANQLPPILDVAMVAIDEASSQRLGENLSTAVSACLAGLFEGEPASTFQADLQALEDRLNARRISCRVFSSAVPLPSAKWSSQ